MEPSEMHMICPKCHLRSLAPVALVEDGATALTCTYCHGLWVSAAGILAAPVDCPEAIPEHDREADQKAGTCPLGHGILMRARPPIEPSFHLDRCLKCGGVWFDQGEWQRIAAAGLTQGLFEMWTLCWKKERLAEDAERRLRESVESNLGVELVDQVRSLAGSLAEHPYRGQALAYLQEEMKAVRAAGAGTSGRSGGGS